MTNAAKIERSPNADSSAFPDTGNMPNFAVKHYSVKEIASLWALSDDAIRKIFEKEPGILVVGNQVSRRGKRCYTTLRIPKYVVERVHERLTKGVDCAPC